MNLLRRAMEEGPDFHDWFFYYSNDVKEQERLIERAQQHKIDTRALCVTAPGDMLADVVSGLNREIWSGGWHHRLSPLDVDMRAEPVECEKIEQHLILISIR